MSLTISPELCAPGLGIPRALAPRPVRLRPIEIVSGPHAYLPGKVVFPIHPPAAPAKTAHEAQRHSALDRVNAVCRPPGNPRQTAVNEVPSCEVLILLPNGQLRYSQNTTSQV
jgi:hypothetical protein